jgi:hypothetical protein
MKILAIISFSLLVLTLAGCSTNSRFAASLGATPSPAKSEYFKSELGDFVFQRGPNGGFESCRYMVGLRLLKFPEGALYLRTQFENPADASDPFVVDTVMSHGDQTCEIESPTFRGLRSQHVYKVEVLIFDSPERKQPIGSHVQYLKALVSF